MGVHCFGDKGETQTVTQVENCFIFILCFHWFYMSGHVTVKQKCAVGNAKIKTKALYIRVKVHGPSSPSLSPYQDQNERGKKKRCWLSSNTWDDKLVKVNTLLPIL